MKNLHDQGMISEEQYQRGRLGAGIENAKRYFDKISGISSSMVKAIQQAEIDQEAKYDVLIQEAENNGEDTAALEEEKENKKLRFKRSMRM